MNAHVLLTVYTKYGIWPCNKHNSSIPSLAEGLFVTQRIAWRARKRKSDQF